MLSTSTIAFWISLLVSAVVCITAPPPPVISESFVALLHVNYSSATTTSFVGLEHYAADADKHRRVLNITDDAMTYHLTQLNLYDSGKSYQVQWNAGVTDGTCNSIPTGSYENVFDWLKNASLVDYDEFLGWEVWSYSNDNDTHAVLIVSTSNRNVPINVMFQNKTLSYDTTFLSFEEKKLSDEYYTLPSFCNKSVSRKRPSIEAAKLNVVPSFPTIKVKNSDGPKTGYYVVHPVVKEMVEKAKMRFGNI